MVKIHNSPLIILLFILAAMSASLVKAAQVSATVDRNPVNLDESFQLMLTVDGDVDADPDLDVLKKDFDILGRSQSSSFQIINGHMSRKSQWAVSLMPKTTGQLIIPPIYLGSDSSQAITMTITQPSMSTQTTADVFLEVSVNVKESYIQEQLIYVVRLFRSVNLGNNASLTAPQPGGVEAIIEKLGDDTEFGTQRNGKVFRVIERRYAIFPQQSGVLTLEPILFEGQIIPASSRFSNNPLFQNGRTKRLRSEALTVNVKAAPPAQSGKPWLPASRVTLKEAWQQSPPVFKVGEAVTRTITLLADGLPAAQLPEVSIAMPAGIKHYSDKAVLEDQKKTTGIVGSRQQKIAIIPAQEGQYTLPEITLDWWNTRTGRSETLRLPQRKITVMAADVSVTPVNNDTAVIDDTGSPVINATGDAAKLTQFEALVRAGFWPWISLGLLLGWLATFLIMRTRKAPVSNQRLPQSTETMVAKGTALNRVRQACLDNDPGAAKEALLVWARIQSGNPTLVSLTEIAGLNNGVISAELALLNQTLYSKTAGDWSGQALWQAIERFNNANAALKKSRRGKQLLAPLYP